MPLFSVMVVKTCVSNGCLIFAGLKASDVQTAGIATIASFTQDRFTNQCHQQTSLTAGTIFAYSKLPLTIWFLAIYLITQEKNGVSALELSRSLGISYNATWRLKHKLMQAMKERDDEVQLSGIIQLDGKRP